MMGSLFNPQDFKSSFGQYEDTPLSFLEPGDFGYEPARSDWSVITEPQGDWAYGSGDYRNLTEPTWLEKIGGFLSGTVAPLAETAAGVATTWREFKNLDHNALALESPAPKYIRPTEQSRYNMGSYKPGAARTPKPRYVGAPPGQGLAGAIAPNVLILLIAMGFLLLKGKN